MTILVVAATPAEIAPFTDYIRTGGHELSPGIFENGAHRIEFLISGVGMVATTYSLMKRVLSRRFDLVLQVGIGGSFDRNIALGSTVFVVSEQFGDLGAEDHYQFRDIFELRLESGDNPPFHGGKLLNPLVNLPISISLPQASGLTINQVSGSSFTADRRCRQFGCQLESMEGAALHFVCLSEGIPFAQVRSISNYVEARNRSAWKIGEAVKALNDWLIDFSSVI